MSLSYAEKIICPKVKSIIPGNISINNIVPKEQRAWSPSILKKFLAIDILNPPKICT